jgi:ribonucleoside-triphosphate reductase
MKCGRETEVYSRVVGYHRPVRHWNKGKQEEFRQRREYDVDKAVSHVVDEAKIPDPPVR